MTLREIAKSAKSTLSDAVRSVMGVRDNLATIDREYELTLQAIEEQRALPIHQDDAVTRVRMTVDERAAHFERRFGRLADAISLHPADPTAERWRKVSEDWLLLAPSLEGQPASMKDFEAGLCFVFGDLIKSSLERAVRARDHSAQGPRASDRAATLAKLGAELIKLRAERDEIVDALAALRREGEESLS